MPEQRLQRCREAYQSEDQRRIKTLTAAGLLHPSWRGPASAAYRITLAQRAAEQRMVGQALKDLQVYAGRSSREPL